MHNARDTLIIAALLTVFVASVGSASSAQGAGSIPAGCHHHLSEYDAASSNFMRDFHFGMLIACMCDHGDQGACHRHSARFADIKRQVDGMGVIIGIGRAQEERDRAPFPDPSPGVPQGGSASWGIGGGLSPDGH